MGEREIEMNIKPEWLTLWERMVLWNGARILADAEYTGWLSTQVNAVTVRRLQAIAPIEHEGVRYTHSCVLKFEKGAAISYLLGELYDAGAQLPLE